MYSGVLYVFVHCRPIPQAINRGIDAVRKIVEEKQLSGVYGPLIENFTCEPRVFTAIEVTAGNRYVKTLIKTAALMRVEQRVFVDGRSMNLPLHE